MIDYEYNWLMETIKDISAQTAQLFVNSGEEKDCFLSPEPGKILKNVFGYDSFRPLQQEVIQNILDGRDTLAVMPTGGGKSLCYQIPALILPGLTVVVSPLIALMQDQVSQLEAIGINAVFLNSTLEWNDYKSTVDRIRAGEIKLLYVSPEGLNTERIQNILHSENVTVSCITVDEAHCISEWGHDFRPDYLEISAVREQFPKAVCLALTATATKNVQSDIIRLLKLETPAVLVSSFNRPNIYLEVRHKTDAFRQTMEYLKEHQGERGIIYCFSRKQVDDLTQKLHAQGFNVLNYHAGLSEEERTKHQQSFIQDKVDIMVCTVAFGMGINKPDIRFVIHYDIPKSVEQYYQEIGRAGRDGLPAKALLLYSLSDIHKIRYFFNDAADPAKAEKLLQGMINFAEKRTCRRQAILNYFGEPYSPLNTGAVESECCCDVCRQGPAPEVDVTIPAQKFMSCILRTSERYGATYIIDILLGAKNQRIMDNGHNHLSTWGIGKELSKENWYELNNSLIDAGYIFKTEEHSVLYITEAGHQALKQRQQIFLPIVFSAPKKKSDSSSLAKPSKIILRPDETDEESARILRNLRFWRTKTADENNIAPYMLFGDKTMYDIAAKKPSNMEELLNCYGIGEMKAKKFGSQIISIVNNDY